jgi:hypothetical protein
LSKIRRLLSPNNKDTLDNWSKLRSKDLMAVNAKLRDANLRNSLMNSFNNGGWNTYESYGVWVFNHATGRWCYLPFGGYGNRNPYGWGYNYNIWHCQMPTIILYTPPSSGGGTTVVNPLYTGAKRDPRGERDPRQTNPPSVIVDTNVGKPVERDRPVFESSRDSGSSDTGSRFEPSYNPPTSRSEPSYNPPTSRSEPTNNPPPPPANTGAKVKDN